MSELCCPCDLRLHPPKPDIAAGLDALPRQLAGFPEYRLAMLREIGLHPPLAEWRAREGDDFGILLLEMWAYVLDVLGFYDERIANETYLRTAQRRVSLRRLTELIGYRPRPALAASAVLAAQADSPQPLPLPAGTAFRSQAFDDEPPQIFESDVDSLISPRQNEWTVAPIRAATADGDLLLDPPSVALARNGLALAQIVRVFEGEMISAATLEEHAARVVDAAAIEALDGATYVRADLDPPLFLGPDVKLENVTLLTPTLSARANPLAPTGDGTVDIVLDSLYPQLATGDRVLVERGSQLVARSVTVGTMQVSVTTDATTPATSLVFTPALDAGWTAEGLTVHFQMIDGGRPTRPAKTLLTRDDLIAAPLAGPVEPLESEPPEELLLHDADERGDKVSGTVAVSERGEATLSLGLDEPELERPLRAPAKVYGNLVAVTRGESVFNEVLGSGDASRAFQRFGLQQSPLTYLNDPAAPGGRRSTLSVRVNGLLWSEVPSFFGAGPEDQVYIVRENEEEESIVTFGDGTRGARPPTGVDNVVASYRHGAGAAKPPANSITQLARPVPGLGTVLQPVAAGGGADRDQPADLRRNAPAGSLTLGRAVSLVDFEALAREFGGVVNAQADWAWDGTFQRAVVKVWFIGDGGDIAEPLRAFLIGQAEPDTPLRVCEATPLTSSLVIDLEVAERYTPAEVELGVIAALTEGEDGILAPESIVIGCPLFRSRIFERVLGVEGALAVRAMSFDGAPAPFVIQTPEGRYRDFSGGLTVGATTWTAEAAA